MCANESVSVGCEVGEAGTAEPHFEEVGSGRMAFTVIVSLHSCNYYIIYHSKNEWILTLTCIVSFLSYTH